jgi:cell division septation protein DedD
MAVIALTFTGVSLAGSAAAVSPPFTISGQVTSLVGYPAGTAQVAVGFYDGTTWQYSSNVNVGVDGMYSVDATDGPGEYDLYFTVSNFSVPFVNSYYGNGAIEPDGTLGTNPGVINNLTATNTSVNVTLVPAGYITGTVTSAGVPVGGQDVEAFDTVTNEEYDANASTDSAGLYSIKVPAGDPISIGVDSGVSTYFPDIYDNQLGVGNHFDTVTVAADQTRTGIDFNLVSVNAYVAIEPYLQTLGVTPPDLVPVNAATAHLYVSDGLGNDPQVATSYIDNGDGLILSSSVGDYQLQFTNAAGKIYAIESFTFDPTNPNDTEMPANPCIADLHDVNQTDLDLRQPFPIEFTLNSDLSICNAAPSTPTAPTKHRAFVFSGSTTTTVATPTPTPTPTPTETPSASPSPSPSASSTPAPKITTPGGGLPWWVWLLIVVGILIIAAIAFVLFRRR